MAAVLLKNCTKIDVYDIKVNSIIGQIESHSYRADRKDTPLELGIRVPSKILFGWSLDIKV